MITYRQLKICEYEFMEKQSEKKYNYGHCNMRDAYFNSLQPDKKKIFERDRIKSI